MGTMNDMSHTESRNAAEGLPGASGASAPPVRVRSGGRSEAVRAAVGEATLSFLAEGELGFTVVDVAARAGVGRRTVYRWWPTRDDLLVEALQTHVRRVPTMAGTGSWEQDLRELAHRLREFAADPVEMAIATIMAGARFPDFNRMVMDQWQPAIESWRQLVRDAIGRGEVAASCDPGTVINTLLAPIFFSPLTLRTPLGRAQVDALVDLLLAGTSAR